MGLELKQIKFIECWFGNFPAWHDYYLKSCELNPSIQFLIFHDCPPPKRRPANVSFHPLTKAELEARTQSRIGINVKLMNGFKVCDLRPAFGAIFEDYLGDADFWGYNDSDVFWGRMRHFLTPEVLRQNDVVTSSRTCISGQCTLFKNSGISREPFKLLPDYAKWLSTPEPGYQDEIPLDRACENAGLRIHRRQFQIHDQGSAEWEERARQRHITENCPEEEWFWEGGSIHWEDGRVIHSATGKEAMFFHFKSWKGHWKQRHRLPRLDYWDNDLRGFHVSEQGIQPLFLKNKLLGLLHKAHYRLRYYAPHQFTGLVKDLIQFSNRVGRGLKRRLSI